MKKYYLFILLLPVIFSCSQKSEIPSINSWIAYDDPYTHLKFIYPENWTLMEESGRVSIYSSLQAVDRFVDLSREGENAARLTISYEKSDSVNSLPQFMDIMQKDLVSSGFEISSNKDTVLFNLPVKVIKYFGDLDVKNRLYVKKICTKSDSFFYSISYEGLNKMYDHYYSVFDTVIASFEIPKLTKTEPNKIVEKPSEDFVTFENNYLKISHPSDFDVTIIPPKSPAVYSMDISGYRNDSFIHLDILPAQNLTIDKVVKQNEKFYRVTSMGTTTINGIETVYLDYVPRKEIHSRVYFLVMNNNIYRIIFNYFTPMKADYLPSFEKVIASLEVK